MSVVGTYLRQQVPAAGPFRVMALGVLVTTAGEGAWYTSWAIYFTTVARIAPGAVGLGLLIAGGAGLLGAAPLGALADRLGPRGLLIALIGVDAVSMAAYVFVRSFWLLLAVAVVNTVADRASSGVKTAYVAGLAGTATRVGELARQRVASHVGYTVGAAIGAVCLSLHSVTAFTTLILVNAATSLVYAALLTRVPPVPPVLRDGTRRRGVVSDRAFVAVVAVTGLLSLCWGLVSTALPLWLVRDTHLPRALAGVVVVLNSVGIAALQVAASRGCDTARAAARRARWSGVTLALACVLFALTRGGHGAVAIALVVVAAFAHLAGELWFVAAQWGLTLALTPPGETGRYQGITAAAQAGAQMISPAVMTLAVGEWGQPGWFVLGAGFLLAGAATVPAASWAQRTRPVRDALAVG